MDFVKRFLEFIDEFKDKDGEAKYLKKIEEMIKSGKDTAPQMAVVSDVLC